MLKKVIVIFIVLGIMVTSVGVVLAKNVEFGTKITIGIGDGTNQLPTGSRAYGVVAYENYLYVAAYQQGLQVFDVTEPESVVRVTPNNTNLQGNTETDWNGIIYQKDGFLYVAFNTPVGVIRKYSLEDPANPVLVAKYNVAGVMCMEVQGDYLYVGSRFNRGLVFNNNHGAATDPMAISYLRRFSNANIMSIKTEGNIMFFVIGGTIYALDITNPTSLIPETTPIATRTITGASFNQIEIYDGYLYCNDTGNKKIYKVDISLPSNIGDESKYSV